VLTVVNLDLFNRQELSFRLPLPQLGLPGDRAYEVEDLLHQTRFTWHGEWQTVALDPAELPALIFKLKQ
jgi:starch synthase (maltosyl-transferring)